MEDTKHEDRYPKKGVGCRGLGPVACLLAIIKFSIDSFGM